MMPAQKHSLSRVTCVLTVASLAVALPGCKKSDSETLPVVEQSDAATPPEAEVSTTPPPAAEPQNDAKPEAATPAQPQSKDLRDLIEAQLAAGAKDIVVPPGRYPVSPENREHLRLAGLRDVTIIADGVELVCTETTRAITIDKCENLTIRGLTIDYDPLPFTQARIVSISEDKKQLEVEIIEGYPQPKEASASVEVFDPATNQLRSRITYFSTACKITGPGKATLTKSNAQAELAREQVGDIAVIKSSHAPGGEIPHAIMATASTGLTLENVTLYASGVFGFFENGCDGSRYIGCKVDRRAPESDPVKRGYMRLRSLNADAYHSKNARRGPTYERCLARYMGDDAIAINGDFHFVTAGEGTSLRVLAKHKMTMRVGDEVQIFTFDGRRLANQKIVSIEQDSETTPEERALIAKQNMNENLRKNAMADGFKVTLDAPVDVPPGSVIGSADSIGNGFAIRNCELGHNRSRGILVKAGRGEITDNVIEGSVMTAILISPEYWWLEAGLSDDLKITGNRIVNGGGMGIAVVAAGGNGSLAPAGAFNNIEISNNVIEGGATPGLLASSIRGFTAANNTVTPDPEKALFPWEMKEWAHGGLKPVMQMNVE